jgi:hypothetical protein
VCVCWCCPGWTPSVVLTSKSLGAARRISTSTKHVLLIPLTPNEAESQRARTCLPLKCLAPFLKHFAHRKDGARVLNTIHDAVPQAICLSHTLFPSFLPTNIETDIHSPVSKMKCAMVVLGSLAMASAFVPAAPKMSRSKYTWRAGRCRT